MYAYVIRRVMLLIPTLVLLTVIVFLVIRLMPGKIVDMMVTMHGKEELGTSVQQGQILDAEAIRHMLGLDVPIYVQYGRWVGDIILHGNFGQSMWSKRSLMDEFKVRIPVTFELGLLAIIVSTVIALPVGIYSAIRQDTLGDYAGRTLSILALAVPGFWIGTMIMVYPSIWWNWSPAMQYINFSQNPTENLKMVIIPAVLLGASMSGGTMRYSRTMMLEVLRQDYVRTAWSKGLRERVVVLRHALRNTLIPLITIMAPEVSMLIGGSVIMEQIFNLPGMGRYLLQTITDRDYLVVSGANLLYGAFTMFLILATDLSYAYLDPRVRYR
jgi:peptide/nickel transport system permease protein